VSSGTSLTVSFSAEFGSNGWRGPVSHPSSLSAPAGSWMTAMKANLDQIPDGSQVGVSYQVNLSGSGWLSWASDGEETGNVSGEQMPLEAVKMKLTGAQAGQYDIYYKVLQNGGWTEWAMNEAAAGVEGQGLRVDGLRAAVVPKGSGEPSFGSVDPTRPMIALTFDDGPSSSVTSRVLNSLQANGGRATFFMLGCNVNSHPDVIQRMVAQGCEVANHTHDHKYINHLTAEQIYSQLTSTNDKIQAICGVAPVIMRPPGGNYDAASLATLAQMGIPAIYWSIDTRDWQHRNAQKTIDTVLSQVRDGDIILMHDIYSATGDAAEVLIPRLTAMGYQLVTVSELAAARGGMTGGQVYRAFRP
jgi:peptidoglycan/xylan/chitin deacetylase (PgdA/CDA1 family)